MEILHEPKERKYQKLRRLGQELKIPTFEAFLELEVRDGNGRITHHHRQRSHSWVRNAYNHLFCQMAAKDANDATFGAGKLSGKQTNGTVRGIGYPFGYGESNSVDGTSYGLRAAAGIDTKGIQVGSGTNAETFEDYALQTQIANGTGAGQMSYIASEVHSIAYDAGTKVLRNTLIRYFNNNSGGNVNVNEVGIVAYLQGQFSQNYMMSRDKLPATITVPTTGQLRVTYTIQLTYPA
ncbi:hypothetical protein ASJ33_04065 [Dehalococcoides mccartyi]|uniref:hypothetical protein n=1 Tax=Dehalococcoides mccartyi TaxID=61435 RepID=UPI00090B2E9E|nr:hypothetical protein [Dehalococcoides mccartyi]APH12382.1 hypothetical protein ASJ33_04065 [Dehalococcoides mccartyi]